MGTGPRRSTRPYLIRAAIGALVALVGVVVASFGDLRSPVTSDKVAALAGAGALLVGGFFAVRGLAGAVRAGTEDHFGDRRGTALGLVVTVVGYLVVVLSVLGALRMKLEGFLLGGAVTGVVIGIAAQQTLGNFFAGMVLLIVRPFRVDDEIVLRSGPLGGEFEGRVTDMGLFYVTMETAQGPVVLPNAGVLGGAIGPGARSAKETTEESVAEFEATPAESPAQR